MVKHVDMFCRPIILKRHVFASIINMMRKTNNRSYKYGDCLSLSGIINVPCILYTW